MLQERERQRDARHQYNTTFLAIARLAVGLVGMASALSRLAIPETQEHRRMLLGAEPVALCSAAVIHHVVTMPRVRAYG